MRYFRNDGSEFHPDPSEVDDEGILLDGQTHRTPVQLMDGFRLTRHQLIDAMNERRVAADEAKDQMLDRYEAWVSNAWKNPKPVLDTSTQQQQRSAAKPRDMETVYNDYEKRTANAWRTP